MTTAQNTTIPTLFVFAIGVAWGFYWIPVRAMEDAGLVGAWGSLVIVFAAICILAPLGLRSLIRNPISKPAAFAMFLGGFAFILYSIGFVYGRVAIIILLFFLTPVWSTAIARFVMGWPTPRLRIYAIAVGLAGLLVMLSADGTAPIPRNLGEWMALASGLAWSIATTMMRVTPSVEPKAAALLFALGSGVCAGALAPFLSSFPAEVLRENTVQIAMIAIVTGAVFWAGTMIALLWAVPQLDPARVGILLMAEVLIGTLTAAWLAGEHVSAVEITGGALVLIAGVLEVWPVNPPAKNRH